MYIYKKSPFLITLSLVLFCLLAIGFLIWIGQDIIIPIAFSVLLAILLLPLNNFFEKKITRVWAISLSLLISLTLLSGLIYFFTYKIAGFVDDLPTIKRQLNHHLRPVQNGGYSTVHLTRNEQKQ